MVHRQRLDVVNVEADSPELAAIKRFDHRPFIDDGATPGVDQESAAFHQRYFLCTDQADSLRVEVNVNRDDIRFPEQSFHGYALGSDLGGPLESQTRGPTQ